MSAAKKPVNKPNTKKSQKFGAIIKIIAILLVPFLAIKNRMTKYLSRRPHRSFRPTRRRDYVRTLKLPGYFAFTKHVRQTLWKNRKTFLILALVYIILTALMVGIASQDVYGNLVDTFNATSGDGFGGILGEVGKAGLLFVSTATGGLSGSLSEAQQIFGGLIILMAWLTSVWLLRNILAGHKVKFRDGLYNAGAPILPTLLVALILIIQLIPAALALIGFGAASSTGFLNGGIEAMLFWVVAGLLLMISLYFITSTIFALIIVTLPGTYPFAAIKMAGDLMIGRRIKILLRLLWLIVGVVFTWAIIMIPIIIFDGWLKLTFSAIDWLPIIPVFILALGSLTVIWASSYVYLLYRKVIEDESDPA
ncbi:MAG: hypothetical protein WCP11_01985 [Candidatus Saccharibacteria bacterium]